jgi:hypothetical protein
MDLPRAKRKFTAKESLAAYAFEWSSSLNIQSYYARAVAPTPLTTQCPIAHVATSAH